MLLNITGVQPATTKNTAVFHSNSVKYHFKQSSCSTRPTATTPERTRRGEGGRLPKGSLAAEGGRAMGSRSPRDGFSWQARLPPKPGHEEPRLSGEGLPHGLQLPSPPAEGKHTDRSVFGLLPLVSFQMNLRFHSVMDSIKSSPFQHLCTNPCVTQTPLTLCQHVLTGLARGSQASSNIHGC